MARGWWRRSSVPRRLRGIEAGLAPTWSGLDPSPHTGRTPWSTRQGRSGLPGGSISASLPSPAGRLRPTTRRAAWRRAQARRLLAALLAGAATWLVVGAVVPHPVETGVPVVVAAHDLALGARVGADDVRLEHRPVSQRPGSAVPDLAHAVGQVTAGPVGQGELLTTNRFRGPSALAGLAPTRVAVSIPLVDDGLLPALHIGDSVTVLAPGTGSRVATAAPVLSVTSSDGSAGPGGADLLGRTSSGGTGARLVVGLTTQEAIGVAAAMGGASGLTGFVIALGGG